MFRWRKESLFASDLVGEYRKRSAENVDGKTRKTGTRLQGCPWEAFGKKVEMVAGRYKKRNSQHNHEAPENMAGHPGCRKMTGTKRVAYRNVYQLESLHIMD